MKFHYYHDTDSLYVEFSREPSAETREIANGLNVDLDARGKVVGFDVDLAAEGLDPQKPAAALTAMGLTPSKDVRVLFHRIAAVERMRRRAWAPPAGCAFDRDEANQR